MATYIITNIKRNMLNESYVPVGRVRITSKTPLTYRQIKEHLERKYGLINDFTIEEAFEGIKDWFNRRKANKLQGQIGKGTQGLRDLKNDYTNKRSQALDARNALDTHDKTIDTQVGAGKLSDQQYKDIYDKKLKNGKLFRGMPYNGSRIQKRKVDEIVGAETDKELKKYGDKRDELLNAADKASKSERESLINRRSALGTLRGQRQNLKNVNKQHIDYINGLLSKKAKEFNDIIQKEMDSKTLNDTEKSLIMYNMISEKPKSTSTTGTKATQKPQMPVKPEMPEILKQKIAKEQTSESPKDGGIAKENGVKNTKPATRRRVAKKETEVPTTPPKASKNSGKKS